MGYFILECKRMFTNRRFMIGCFIVFLFLLCGAYDMFLPGYDLVEAMIFSLGANATAILALRSTAFFWLSGSFLYNLNDWEKPLVIWRYILYSFTALTGIMIYLVSGILVIGKMRHMHGLFAYTFFYNIVVQDDVPISITQKVVFWTLSLLFLIDILLIVIQHVDLGISRNVREAVRYIFNKYYMNPWLMGTAVWSCIYAAITYRISKNFYSSPGEFVFICFRGSTFTICFFI